MSTRLRVRAVRMLVVLMASLVALGALAPSAAQAEPSTQQTELAWAHWKDPAKTTNGGLAQTRSHIHNIVVEDFYADGWGTRGQLQIQKYNPAGYYYWVDHGGECFDDTSTGGATVCQRSVPKGQIFRVHVWASKSGTYQWHNYSPGITAQ